MPSIERLQLSGGLHTRFARMKTALLPEEIANDGNAQWIMRYDAFTREQRENDISDEELFYRDSASIGRDSVRWSRMTAGYFTASLLQARIPFYFASLFHIGRQIKVTQVALQDCRTLQDTENISASAQNLVDEARRGRLGRRNINIRLREATQIIMGLCDAAVNQHESSLTIARNWWRDWQTEVAEIRRLVSQIEEYASSENRRGRADWMQPAMRLMLLSSRQSPLQNAMTQGGVKFKAEAAPMNALSTQGMPHFMQMLSMVALASLTGYPDDHPFHWHHLDHILYEYIQELREAKFAPAVEAAVKALHEKYGTENPFLKYAVGVRAPDEALMSLIRENQLPNNQSYVWLSDWHNSFPHDLSYDRYSSLSNSNAPLDELSLAAAWDADNQIKRVLARNSWPGIPWNAYLQTLFEKEWLRYHATLPVRVRQNAQDNVKPMDFDTFLKYVSMVVDQLNAIGYALEVPPLNLLRDRYHEAISEQR